MASLFFLGQGFKSQSKSKLRQQLRILKQKEKHKNNLKKETIDEAFFSDEEQRLITSLDKQLHNGRPVASERICPECKNQMIVIDLEGVEVETCQRCQGCWFDPGELKMLTRKDEDIPSGNLKNRQSKYACPACRQIMTEYVFLAPHNLLVDRCLKCQNVYLEKGELERIFKLD